MGKRGAGAGVGAAAGRASEGMKAEAVVRVASLRKFLRGFWGGVWGVVFMVALPQCCRMLRA